MPGGILAEKYGGRSVTGYTLLISSILTALTPLAAAWSMLAVWILRFLTGLVGVCKII